MAILPPAAAAGSPVPRRSATTTRQPRAPLAAGWALRRIRELAELAPVPGAVRHSTSESPLPPRRLRARAGVPGARQYREGAGQAASELAGAVASTGRSAQQVASVLDFGCGAGRVLPHFVALAAASRGAGCDVDGDAIAWAQANLPGFQWTVSSFEPPLPYPADSFDLVYSISVFSHLGARLEALWLRELRRVLVAGGVALLSVHGAHAFEEFRSGRVRTAWCAADVFDRSALSDHERVFVPYVRSTWTEGDLPGIGREYGLAFHGSERVRQAWGDQLEVIDVLERTVTGWQDLVVCRNGKEEE